MLTHGLHLRAWMIASFYLLGFLSQVVYSKEVYSGGFSSIKSSSCPSRTINYITATLPQQCLRTNWSSGQSATAVIGNGATITDSDARGIAIAAQESVGSQKARATAVDGNVNASTNTAQDDGETDPLSDNANFLSFEEWKAQMLQKSGQSPEHVAGPKIHQRKESRGNGINNALDGYGEDGEIEIAFGGFPVPDVSTEAVASDPSSTQKDTAAPSSIEGDKPQKRSKEAGTTSKHRFNYASFDCAATVLKTNPGSKGSTSILSENKDSYMINACALPNKFVIVELCNDINIDTIVLGNFEFFSSTFRAFRVSVADRYPVKADKWEDIGTFEAMNNRAIQAFLVENMRTWARYLRLEFLTHYGAEYYCPVSLLRVHGKTMMDDWKADVKASQGEDDDEEDVEDVGVDKVIAEPVKKTLISIDVGIEKEIPTSTVMVSPEPTSDFAFYDDKCPRMSMPGPLVEQVELVSSYCEHDRRFCHLAKVQRIAYSSVVSRDVQLPQKVDEFKVSANVGKESNSKTDPLVSPSATASSASKLGKSTTSASNAAKSPQPSKVNGSVTSSKGMQKALETPSAVKTSQEVRPGTAAKATPNAIASIAPQDSFFRSVHKRLQQLEANSTLSLQYIEEQSRILREAFTKVEKRQLSKTSSFLETLNATVLTELRQFRLQYDQIWQSTVLELSAQREQSQREVTALSQRLSLLADELLWQRRLAIFQFGLIILCLILVIFSRNAGGTSTFDVPILQNMVSKPRFGRYLGNFESPPESPSRPSSRYGRLARSWTQFRSTSNLLGSDDDNDDDHDDEEEEEEEEGEQLLTTRKLPRKGSGLSENGYGIPTPTSEIDNQNATTGVSRETSLEGSPEVEDELLLRRAKSTPNLGKESEELLESDVDAGDHISEDIIIASLTNRTDIGNGASEIIIPINT